MERSQNIAKTTAKRPAGSIRGGRHKKLKIFGIALLVLILGFFIYKYAYIYNERKKYSQAERAMNKVADDLRGQGIETEFSKGCGRAQEVFGPGALSCSLEILLKDSGDSDRASALINATTKSMTINGFSINSNYPSSLSSIPVPSGNSIYSLPSSELQCRLQARNTWDMDKNFNITLSCSDSTRFAIF